MLPKLTMPFIINSIVINFLYLCRGVLSIFISISIYGTAGARVNPIAFEILERYTAVGELYFKITIVKVSNSDSTMVKTIAIEKYFVIVLFKI